MKRVSLIESFAVRIAVLLFCLWLISMTALTCCLAGDLAHQGSQVCTDVLEQALAGWDTSGVANTSATDQIRLSLSAVSILPKSFLPLLSKGEMTVHKASLTLNELGIIVASDGFETGSASGLHTGLTITEGKLSYIANSALIEGSEPTDLYGGLTPHLKKYAGRPPQVFLTFRNSPLRKGSFPSAEFSDSFISDAQGAFDANKPVTPGDHTDLRLLDGIETGEYRFDSNGILQSSRLRGAWLRNEAGEPRCFVIGAYGWNPLGTAVKLLGIVYLVSLIFFLLTGTLLCLTLRRTVTRPLTRLGQNLSSDPLVVSEKEFDYTYHYRELQNVSAPYLMRRQMQTAQFVLADAPAMDGPGANLVKTYEEAIERLMPILVDRGQDLKREFTSDGLIRSTEDQLLNALLSLIREAVPYLDQGRAAFLRTLEKSGFLLAEIEVRTKRHLSSHEYDLLWEGIFRTPADGNAPGAKLRRDVGDLPGSFCHVRKTKKGLVITVGLPKLT